MPQYTLEDAVTKRRLVVEGDAPPTEAEIADLFKQAENDPGISDRWAREELRISRGVGGKPIPRSSEERAAQNAESEMALYTKTLPEKSIEEKVKEETWKELSATDKLAADAIELERGFKGTLAGAPKGAAIIQESLPPHWNKAIPTAQEYAEMQAWKAKRDAMTGTERQAALESNPLYQTGARLAASAPETPKPQTAMRPLGSALQGLGSVSASLTAAPLGPGAVTAQAYLMELSDAYESEIERQKRSKEPIDPSKAEAKAQVYAAGAVPLEYVGGAVRLARRWFGKAAAEEVKRIAEKEGAAAVTEFFKERIKDSAAEGGTEALQRFYQDAIVEGKPSIANALAEGASAFGGTLILGTGVGGIRQAGKMANRDGTASAPTAPTQPAAPTPSPVQPQAPAPQPAAAPAASVTSELAKEIEAQLKANQVPAKPVEQKQEQPKADDGKAELEQNMIDLADTMAAIKQDILNRQMEQQPTSQTGNTPAAEVPKTGTQVEQPAQAEAATTDTTDLSAALNRYEDTGEISTVSELVDEVDSLIGEERAPQSLQSAVDAYREARKEDREEYGERGDADAYENDFLTAVRQAIGKPEQTQRPAVEQKPQAKPQQPDYDRIALEQEGVKPGHIDSLLSGEATPQGLGYDAPTAQRINKILAGRKRVTKPAVTPEAVDAEMGKRGETQTPLSVSQSVRQQIDTEFPELAGIVDVVETDQQFPDTLKHEALLRGVNAGDIDAAFHEGRVVVNAAQFRNNPAKVRDKMVHEVAVHYGLRKATGDQGMRDLSTRIWNSLTQAEKAAIAQRNGISTRDAEQIGEEWLAYEAERVAREGTSNAIWHKAAVAIRKLLRSMGLNLRLSDQEIAQLVAKGKEAAAQENKQARNPTPVSSSTEVESGQAESDVRGPVQPLTPDGTDVNTGDRFSITPAKIDLVQNFTAEEKKAIDGLKSMAAMEVRFRAWKNQQGGAKRNIQRLQDYLQANPTENAEIRRVERSLGGKVRLLEYGEIARLPIEKAISDDGTKTRFGQFWRSFPQLFLDRMDSDLFLSIHRKVNDAMEQQWQKRMAGAVTGVMPPPVKIAGLRTTEGVAMGAIESEAQELAVQTPIRGAEKTVAALNLNSACPMFMVGNRGCWGDACYLTQMAKGATGTNLFARAMYAGELLQWSDSEIEAINSIGGLRVNGVGDTTLDNVEQVKRIVKHARMRGLKLKFITKQELTVASLAEMSRNGEDISHIQVQPSIDYYWRPVRMDLEDPNSGMRDLAYRDKEQAEQLLNTDNAELMQGIYDQFGREVKRINGQWYRKDGFSWQQFEALKAKYPEVQMLPRVIVGSVQEIIDAATNHPESVITLMHGKLGDGLVSDFTDQQFNYLSSRHKFGWNAKTGEIVVTADKSSPDKYGERKPEAQTKGHKALESFINGNFTKPQRFAVYTNLRRQTCCQENDSPDACADCASHCALRQIMDDATKAKAFPWTKPNATESPDARMAGTKSADTTRLSTSPATTEHDADYSRITRTVEMSQQGKATGAQWKATVRNSKLGINKDEYALVGVDDLEDGKTYTKDQVLDYLKANEVVVKDVTLGGEKKLTGRIEQLFPNRKYRFDAPGLQSRLFDTLDEAKAYQREVSNRVGEEATHYSSYTLPGAKYGSYREVLLTMPDRPNRVDTSNWVATKVGVPDRSISNWFEWRIKDERGIDLGSVEAATAEEAIANRAKEDQTQHWRDGHAQYSNIPNPIVRIRLNERTTSNGKRMLFLEEVQAPQKAMFAKMPELFQKNWREIAFKWALKKAVNEGYDTLGWTTGEQQAARYDLAKKVESIEWATLSDGHKGVTVKPIGESPIDFRVNKDGIIVQPQGSPNIAELPEVEGRPLSDAVGKDVSEKILAGDEGTLAGEGLSFGKQGLQKLYDSDFRNVVNNLPAVRKSGQKVGSAKTYGPDEGDISARDLMESEGEILEPLQVHSIDLTPEVKSAVKSGQSRFSAASRRQQQLPEAPDVANANWRQRAINAKSGPKPYTKGHIARWFESLIHGDALPKQMREARQWGLNFQKYIEESISLLKQDARRALHEEFKTKGERAAAEARLLAYWTGEGELTDVGGPALQRAAEAFRQTIDQLTEVAVTNGLVPEQLADTWLENRGAWLKRTYLAFDPTADWNYDTLKRRAAAGDKEIRRIWSGIVSYLTKQNPKMTPAELEAVMRSLIDRREVEDLLGIGTTGQPGSGKRYAVDTGSLIRRKKLPVEVREWMGQIKDPFALGSQSGKWMAQFITRNLVQRKFARLGLELGILSDTALGREWVELYPNQERPSFRKDEQGNLIPAEDGGYVADFRKSVDRRHEPLHGFYTSPEFQAALADYDAVANASRSAMANFADEFFKLYLGTVGYFKLAKVGLNPYSYGVNTIGGMVTRMMAGAVNPVHFRDAYAALLVGSKDLGENPTPAQERARKIYLQAVKAGVTGKGILLGDVRANLNRAGNPSGFWDAAKKGARLKGGEALEALRNMPAYQALLEVLEDPKGEGSWVRLKEATTDLVGAMGNVGIRFMDDVYRISAFLDEIALAKEAHPNMTEQEQMEWAADRALNIYQNYDRIYPIMRQASRVGILNTFVTFKFEFFRNAYWIGRYAAQGIKSDNPALRKDGYKKAVGLLATAAAPYALAVLSRALTDTDDDDVERLKRWSVPPWDRGEELVVLSHNGAKWRYVPMGYLLPSYELTRAFNLGYRSLNDPNPDLAVAKALKGMAADYFGPGGVAGPAIEAVSNKRLSGGPITYAEGTRGMMERAGYLMRQWRPNIGDPLMQAYMGATGQEGTYGRQYDATEVGLKLGGIRTRTVDVEKQVPFVMREFSERWRNSVTYANVAKRRYPTDTEKQNEAKAYAEGVQSDLKRQYKAFYQDMIKIGVTPGAFLKAEKEATLPTKLRYSRASQSEDD